VWENKKEHVEFLDATRANFEKNPESAKMGDSGFLLQTALQKSIAKD